MADATAGRDSNQASETWCGRSPGDDTGAAELIKNFTAAWLPPGTGPDRLISCPPHEAVHQRNLRQRAELAATQAADLLHDRRGHRLAHPTADGRVEREAVVLYLPDLRRHERAERPALSLRAAVVKPRPARY